MANDDVALPADDVKDELSVKDLLAEIRKRHDERALKYLSNAELNERFINGDQFIALSDAHDVVDAEMPNGVPKARRNLLRNLALTWAARVLEDRPDVHAWPNAANGADMAAATVANAVLSYCHQTHDFDDLMYRAAMLVQPHGVIGIKVTWDPLKGSPSKGYPALDPFGNPATDELGRPVMEGEGEPEGDVSWDIVTIFDVLFDGAEQIEDATCVTFHRLLDYWDAKALYRTVGIDDDPPRKQGPDLWGDVVDGVEAFEIWHRPGSRFPDGLFALVVGDRVLEARTYPYEHHELPIAMWKCGERRGSPYGSSHVDDAVPIQRAINEDVAALQRQVRELATVKALVPSSVADQWEADNQILRLDDIGLAQIPRYLEPPNRLSVLSDSLEDNTQALFAVFGLNELLTGADSIKSGTAAKSIAYLNKLDSMKLSGTARSLGKCIQRIMRQSLRLYQQYVKAPRLIQIAGEQNAMQVSEFIGADIAGVDVRLEPQSGIERYRAQGAEGAMQAGAQGLMPPERAAELGQTGLNETAFEGEERVVMQQLIDAVLKGAPPEPDLSISAPVALGELVQAMGMTQDPNARQVLMQLARAYQQAGAQQQTDQAAMQAAQGNAPGGLQ